MSQPEKRADFAQSLEQSLGQPADRVGANVCQGFGFGDVRFRVRGFTVYLQESLCLTKLDIKRARKT